MQATELASSPRSLIYKKAGAVVNEVQGATGATVTPLSIITIIIGIVQQLIAGCGVKPTPASPASAFARSRRLSMMDRFRVRVMTSHAVQLAPQHFEAVYCGVIDVIHGVKDENEMEQVFMETTMPMEEASALWDDEPSDAPANEPAEPATV